MPEGKTKAPAQGVEHTINRGSSWDEKDGLVALRYAFKPASIDDTKEATLSQEGERYLVEFGTMNGDTTVLRGHGVKEKEVKKKDTECILLWDGKNFQLEKLSMQVTALRHVRDSDPDGHTAPAQGKRTRAQRDSGPSNSATAAKKPAAKKASSSSGSSSSGSSSSGSSSGESSSDSSEDGPPATVEAEDADCDVTVEVEPMISP